MSERKPTVQQRRSLKECARGICEYCRSQSKYSSQPYSVEHIKPFCQGGRTILSNLAYSCQGCNGHKYTHTKGRDPMTRRLVSLFYPRKQRWSDHFTWSEDFTLIIGITATGRATVHILQLNREGCTNLRYALHLLDKHPPKED